jgi:hypothetical protein
MIEDDQAQLKSDDSIRELEEEEEAQCNLYLAEEEEYIKYLASLKD